jgi:hypothetical protein
MFTRTVTYTGARDLDGGLDFVREHALPVLRQQQGYRGLTASVDRSHGVLGVLSMWESAAARDASDSALGKVRDDGLDVIGGELKVEAWEELYVEMVAPPAIGSPLLLQRVAMDPELVDTNSEYFRMNVVPEMKGMAGFCGVRNMINRETGHGMTGTLWSDPASLQAAASYSEERRERAAALGVSFGEQSKREIALLELP